MQREAAERKPSDPKPPAGNPPRKSAGAVALRLGFTTTTLHLPETTDNRIIRETAN
jgi:hypothetical protein